MSSGPAKILQNSSHDYHAMHSWITWYNFVSSTKNKMSVPRALKFRFQPTPRKLKMTLGFGSGPEGRIMRLRQVVTAMVRFERLEMSSPRADEARGYLERVNRMINDNVMNLIVCRPSVRSWQPQNTGQLGPWLTRPTNLSHQLGLCTYQLGPCVNPNMARNRCSGDRTPATDSSHNFI
jgi:hypothetical protein